MAWFQRLVFSDKKLLIWRAMLFWKEELFSYLTRHRSTKSHKIFLFFWGRFEKITQSGPYIRPLAGKLLNITKTIIQGGARGPCAANGVF